MRTRAPTQPARPRAGCRGSIAVTRTYPHTSRRRLLGDQIGKSPRFIHDVLCWSTCTKHLEQGVQCVWRVTSYGHRTLTGRQLAGQRRGVATQGGHRVSLESGHSALRAQPQYVRGEGSKSTGTRGAQSFLGVATCQPQIHHASTALFIQGLTKNGAQHPADRQRSADIGPGIVILTSP